MNARFPQRPGIAGPTPAAPTGQPGMAPGQPQGGGDPMSQVKAAILSDQQFLIQLIGRLSQLAVQMRQQGGGGMQGGAPGGQGGMGGGMPAGPGGV